MPHTRLQPRRFGLVPLSVVIIATFESLFVAWVSMGLDEDRRQREAVEEFGGVGSYLFYDYFPKDESQSLEYDLRPRWRNPHWLWATPKWNSRWWISTFIDPSRPMATVFDVRFEDANAMTDAQWTYYCGAFRYATSVSVRIPIKDGQLRFLTAMTRLEDLMLDDCGDDSTLAVLPRFKRLESLSFVRSRITDAGLVHLRNLPELDSLDIEDTPITDAGVRHLEGLKIISLQLRETGITDRGVAYLTRVPTLVELDLAGTDVTDAAIPDLVKLKNLRALSLSNTKATDAGCKRLFEASPNLEFLHTAKSYVLHKPNRGT